MSHPDDDTFLESMSFLTELRRAAKGRSGSLAIMAAEAPRDMLLLRQAGWTTTNGGRDWRHPESGEELSLIHAACREREARAMARAQSKLKQADGRGATGAGNTASAPAVHSFSPEVGLRGLSDAIQYVEQRVKSDELSVAEENCGWRSIRLALIKLVSWLGYISRGGRNRDSLLLDKAPLSAMRCLLVQDLALREFFEMDGDRVVWRKEVPAEVRVAAVTLVGEQYRPRIRE